MSKSQKKAVAKSGSSKATKGGAKSAKSPKTTIKTSKAAKSAARPATLGSVTHSGSKVATQAKSKAQPKSPAKSAAAGAKSVLTKAIKGIFGNKQTADKPAAKAAAKSTDKAKPKVEVAPAKGKKGKSSGPSQAELNKTLRATTLSLGKQSGRHSYLDSDSVCREVACEGLASTAGYCRMHYIKNWKKIKRKEVILKEGKLNQYIEELVAKYPDKYIEAIRSDLSEDKSFAKVVYDLELDESIDDLDSDMDSAEALIDTIKRDFEDDGDGF